MISFFGTERSAIKGLN